jgi:hypothetical protein
LRCLGAGVADHPSRAGRDVLSQLWDPGPGRAHDQPGPREHRESGLRPGGVSIAVTVTTRGVSISLATHDSRPGGVSITVTMATCGIDIECSSMLSIDVIKS